MYLNWSLAPKTARVKFDLANLNENEISMSYLDEHTLSALLPYRNSQNRILYYLLEVDKKDLPDATQGINEGLLLYILATLFLMLLIAYLLTKNVIKPLNSLAEFAKQNEVGNSAIPDTLANRIDEIGDVARALNHSLHNIRQQQNREKHFLQNASHELRSPLATIGSALHVINLRQTKGISFESQLLQIKRCYQQMTQLTQALLWLSKEEKSLQTSEFNVSELIEFHLMQLEHLITNKAIEVVFKRDNILIDEARALVDVVVSNLIRNAFENSSGGKIILHHTKSGFSISNPIYKEASSHSQNQGFGLGLHLVNKVTQKQNWQLLIHESEQQMDVQVNW
ncbi:sensor histidine kinase [Marinomonas sp. MED121]|nr:sensor histidine kinase [Marinomonas sp. MED121]